MKRETVRFGIIGLGLMGKEFCSSIARWCNILSDSKIPVIKGICDKNVELWDWYLQNFPDIQIKSTDYKDLLHSDEIDAIYCAVPHNLHEEIYISVVNAGKHLLGEKPFGIDNRANSNILGAINANPDVIVRCSSEFPYFPACQKLIKWIKAGNYGKIFEVKVGFHHSSDMDPEKPINWKRMVELNGEYGCMGDLGMHTLHIPFRMNWKPISVYADLQNIVNTRRDCNGNMVPCLTWDNAILNCKCVDNSVGNEFSMIVETKRMAPGATNTWFIEVYGTKGSVAFSTRDPKAFRYITYEGKEQGWSRIDTGSQSAIESITGSIFEFGFSDAFQQMVGVFLEELSGKCHEQLFKNVYPAETRWSHELFTAALESHRTGRKVKLNEIL